MVHVVGLLCFIAHHSAKACRSVLNDVPSACLKRGWFLLVEATVARCEGAASGAQNLNGTCCRTCSVKLQWSRSTIRTPDSEIGYLLALQDVV
eukprot:5897224-Amphidinium_carterae.1